MRLHILGICGTFMAGIALIAKQLGWQVSGQDQAVYPPMSTLLRSEGIHLIEGYEANVLEEPIDLVVVGNAMKRGMPVIEALLNSDISYLSGPEWLYRHVIKDKRVIAICGTHGKTTTSAMLTWILERAGLNPGFLIGGVPENFSVSARVTESDYFVIEADEYDTAFFDKRSKFIHYHPEWVSINNIEFDHADIFKDLDAILNQFHGLIRMMPSKGILLTPSHSKVIDDLMSKGCWSNTMTFGPGGDCTYSMGEADGREFDIMWQNQKKLHVSWSLIGEHNVNNALVAASLALNMGIQPPVIEEAFHSFRNVKRRLEVKGHVKGITVYDDFAHHPTAIASTLKGLRTHVGHEKIIALLECGSFTMRSGVHGEALINALGEADNAYLYNSPLSISSLPSHVEACQSVSEILDKLKGLEGKAHILVMSNKGFNGLHDELLTMLNE